MEITTLFWYFASFLFIVLFKSLIKSFLFPSNGKQLPLPPGSMGYPYIGETFQMYSQDPSLFFANKIKRFNFNLLTFYGFKVPSSETRTY
jgi:(+)-abscisic acid 8'-hydroxylase